MPRSDTIELKRREELLKIGRKVCTRCGLERSVIEFSKNKNSRDGLHYWCKTCLDESRHNSSGERRHRLDSLSVAPSDMKTCTKCGRVKPKTGFKKRKTAPDGLSWHCRECEREHWLQRKERDGITSGDIAALRSQCKKRGHEFKLSTSQVRDWWKCVPDCCHYCGVTTKEYLQLKAKLQAYDGPSRLVHWARLRHFGELQKTARMTIDRRDNELGYVEGNLVKACLLCNMVKSGVLDEEEMLFIGPHLRQRLEKALGIPADNRNSIPHKQNYRY